MDVALEKYIRERTHQMFTEAPELWNHQGVIRQYLRLAYLDGKHAAAQLAAYEVAITAAREVQDIINHYIMCDIAIHQRLNSDENNTLCKLAAALAALDKEQPTTGATCDECGNTGIIGNTCPNCGARRK